MAGKKNCARSRRNFPFHEPALGAVLTLSGNEWRTADLRL